MVNAFEKRLDGVFAKLYSLAANTTVPEPDGDPELDETTLAELTQLVNELDIAIDNLGSPFDDGGSIGDQEDPATYLEDVGALIEQASEIAFLARSRRKRTGLRRSRSKVRRVPRFFGAYSDNLTPTSDEIIHLYCLSGRKLGGIHLRFPP